MTNSGIVYEGVHMENSYAELLQCREEIAKLKSDIKAIELQGQEVPSELLNKLRSLGMKRFTIIAIRNSTYGAFSNSKNKELKHAD